MKKFKRIILTVSLVLSIGLSSAFANEEKVKDQKVPEMLSGISFDQTNSMTEDEKNSARGTFSIRNVPNNIWVGKGGYSLYDVKFKYKRVRGQGANFIEYSLRDHNGPFFPADQW